MKLRTVINQETTLNRSVTYVEEITQQTTGDM